MNVYIQTDIEGIAGWASFEDVETKTVENLEHRKRMYDLLTAEVNAAAKAAKDSGAQRICINDSHGTGYNIAFEELIEDCEINHGRGSHFPTWLPAMDEGFDALVLVGMHAMGGELEGVCPHSKWVVNDGEIYLSEASMAMALAGDLCIPAVLVSGDQVITSEVRNKVPQIRIAQVKHSYGPFCCRSVQPIRARKLIYNGVKEGLANLGSIEPYKIQGPVKLNLLDSEGHIPPLKPVLAEAATGNTITDAFNKAVKKFPWSRFGSRIMDHYRYPTSFSGAQRKD